MSAAVISIAEWRAVHRPDDGPRTPPPRLRVVGEGELPGDALRLDVFLARGRVVMAERHQADPRPGLRLVRC